MASIGTRQGNHSTNICAKKAVRPDMYGVAVCGGKGSLKTPSEIRLVSERFDFSNSDIDQLEYSSKMSAKVDNTAIQAGYPLYHHAFFLSEKGKWTVVQQGMSIEDRTARRSSHCSGINSRIRDHLWQTPKLEGSCQVLFRVRRKRRSAKTGRQRSNRSIY